MWQWKSIFYGNFFYALCAVSLSLESLFQTKTPIADPLFFFLQFIAVIWFYNKAYLKTEEEINALNERQAWYKLHRPLLLKLQSLYGALLVLGAGFFIVRHFAALEKISATALVLFLIFPAVSFLYYGYTIGGKTLKLRRIGWLKPIIIAVSWAGMVTIYPHLYVSITHATRPFLPQGIWFFFLKNVVFVSLLAILFDIKDYATDLNFQLKTVVVKLGVQKTLYALILPLCLLAWLLFFAYANSQGFSNGRIIMNTVPLLAVVVVTLRLTPQKNILYYLSVIDGLMIIKAICGISATLLFYSSK